MATFTLFSPLAPRTIVSTSRWGCPSIGNEVTVDSVVTSLYLSSGVISAPKSSGLVTSARIAEPEVWMRNLGVSELARAETMVFAEGTWSQSAKSIELLVGSWRGERWGDWYGGQCRRL